VNWRNFQEIEYIRLGYHFCDRYDYLLTTYDHGTTIINNIIPLDNDLQETLLQRGIEVEVADEILQDSNGIDKRLFLFRKVRLLMLLKRTRNVY